MKSVWGRFGVWSMGLGMALLFIILLAGCSGDKGGAISPTVGVSITCMDTAATCGPAASALTIKGLFAWLPDFVPSAHAEIVTSVTSFQGADISLSGLPWDAAVVISMSVENTGIEAYTGYAIADMSLLYGPGALNGGPINLEPGAFTALTYGGSISELAVGSYSLTTYVYNTTADTGDPCDFTVEDRNLWMGVQVLDWIQTCNPTPAAIGTLNFNVVL